MAITLVDLPTEILEKIYQYLSYKDIKSMASTCLRFSEILRYMLKRKKFPKQIVCKITEENQIKYILSNKTAITKELFKCTKVLVVDNLKLIENFFNEYGDVIENLILHKDVLFKEIELWYLIKKLKNLKHLQLEYFDLNPIEENFIQQIESLTIKRSHLNSRTVLSCLMCFEKLKCLEISNCVGGGFSETRSIFSILTKTGVEELHINTPDINRWRSDGGFFLDLRCLNQLHSLNLKKLTCCSGNRLKDSDLESFFPEQKGLLYLDLSNYIYLTDAITKNISENLTHLQYLKLQECRNLTDNSLMYISHLKNLKSLDISHCTQLTDLGIFNGLLKMNQIEELNVSKNYKYTEAGLSSIVKNCQNLRVLNMGHCKVTDDVIRAIRENLHNLRELNVNHCTKVTDYGFINFIDNENFLRNYQQLIPEQEMLSTERLSRTDNEIPTPTSFASTILPYFKSLISLNLDSCHFITDKTIIYGFQHKCLDLKCLILRNTRVTINSIDVLKTNCPSIETLIYPCNDLASLTLIRTVCKIVKKFPNLNVAFRTEDYLQFDYNSDATQMLL